MAGKEIAAVKKYVVRLSAEERDRLEAMTGWSASGAVADEGADPLEGGRVGGGRRGGATARSLWRLDTKFDTIGRTRRRLVEEGLEAALSLHNLNSARPRVFDGAAEAKLIAPPCSPAPEGFARWSLRLLEEKVVELNIVEQVAQHHRAANFKNALKPHRRRQWVIPPDANAGFVAAMEDVLETYQMPRDPDRPLVCLDRNLETDDRRDARADPRQAWTIRPARLRIRAQLAWPISS